MTDDQKPKHRVPSLEEAENVLTAHSNDSTGGVGELITGGLALLGGATLLGALLDSGTQSKAAAQGAPHAVQQPSNTLQFGKYLRQRRNELGWTQKILSEKSGAGLRFISELENGKPTVEMGKTLDVIDALGLRLELKKKSE